MTARTLHAMARQVLLDAGRPVRLLPDRLPLLRAARRRALAEPHRAAGGDPPARPPDPAALDTIVSAWKVEGRPPPPAARTTVQAFQALMDARGLIDFDDLVVGAVAALEADHQLRSRWQAHFSHLCVDEFQDVDAAQLRLVQLLAAPDDNLFVAGDEGFALEWLIDPEGWPDDLSDWFSLFYRGAAVISGEPAEEVAT